MAPQPKTCFISYSHEDIDRDSLEYVIHLLKEFLGANAKLLYDQTLHYGGDFSQFMAMLDKVDVVIIVLTPSYKRKVRDRRGGVHEEFQRIWLRYSNGDSDSRQDLKPTSFELVPLLLSGSRSRSTPEELAHLKHLDLTSLKVRRKPTGEFIVPRPIIESVRPHIEALASQIYAAAAIKTEGFSKLSSSYYDRLFIDLKASFDDPTLAGSGYLESILVKTHPLKRIQSQLSYFVVGRKGSGKSTLTQVLPLLRPDIYQGIIAIVANDFNLEALYSLYSEPQFRSDVNAIVARDKAFEFTWEALLILATLKLLHALLLEGSLTEIQRRIIVPIDEFLRTITNNEEWDTSNLFSFAFKKTMSFVSECINGARSDPSVFLVDIEVRFNRERYLSYVFTGPVLDAFRKIIRTFNRRFLVTLDGFDTAFDRFRIDALRFSDDEVIRRRAHFEVDWLRSLLDLVVQGKTKSTDYLYSVLDFCISVPKDRFMEVNRIERDSYRRWHRWCTLNWSGMELAILLRKRLEVLAGFQTNKDASPRERLEQVLKSKAFKGLPVDIEFEYNGKTYSMPLFMYVLRHTFWRPREVLIYYAALLALSEDMKRWDHELTTAAIRLCIAKTTRYVIESEFLAEFQHSLLNVRRIALAFRHMPFVLDFSKLREILAGVDFEYVSGGPQTLVQKIQFLYEVGFLGLRVEKTSANQMGVNHEDAFAFNEGGDALEAVEESDVVGWKFVIHPVFSEYLKLDGRDQELTLRFDWDYLSLGDALFAANQSM